MTKIELLKPKEGCALAINGEVVMWEDNEERISIDPFSHNVNLSYFESDALLICEALNTTLDTREFFSLTEMQSYIERSGMIITNRQLNEFLSDESL